ncbi:hypothetical protein NKG94_34895 [Micromonospora sp. M12]
MAVGATSRRISATARPPACCWRSSPGRRPRRPGSRLCCGGGRCPYSSPSPPYPDCAGTGGSASAAPAGRLALGMGAALLVVLAWGYTEWRMVPLPPVNGDYYPDVLYHLGLVQELTRAMPFELPHVAGEDLRYHYLSDAHIASGSMITGIAPTTVLLRLWLVPVVGTAVVVAAGLVRDLSGAVWAGPVVALAACTGGAVTLGSAVGASGEMPLSYASPSQTYVLVPLLLLAGLCVDVVRGVPSGRPGRWSRCSGWSAPGRSPVRCRR